MQQLRMTVAVAAMLALPSLALAAPLAPGWNQAAADLEAKWPKQHPTEKIVSIMRLPSLRFRSEGDWFETIYRLEVTVRTSGGKKVLKIGVRYRSEKSAPYVFAGFSEEEGDNAGPSEALPLLDDKDARLIRAAMAGDLAETKAALVAGGSASAKDEEGVPLLTWAANSGDPKVVKLLLDHGAPVNHANDLGITPLMGAATATAPGSPAVAKLLLDKGADVNAKNVKGMTALMLAKNPKLVKLLLDKGADVDVRNSRGATALMLAKSSEVAKLLLGKGADMNAKDATGTTVLMAMADSGQMALVRLLLDKGADVHAKDPQGRTAMDRAAVGRHEDIVRLLRDKEEGGHGRNSAAPAAKATTPSAPGRPTLDAQTCADSCALLTLYAYDDLVANACTLCKKYDDTFCEMDFPFNDVPACDAYDELRNCIFARFGYVFSKPKWQKQFGALLWYKPDPTFSEAKLPPVAKANIQKMKELKAKRHGCQ